MKKYSIYTLFLALLMLTACVKDLDVKPKDPNIILSGNLGDDPANIDAALAKIYASFIISGQGANGGADITAPDENFFTTVRALWNLQEITTDEAICAWGDIGIADLNTQTWSPSNPFLTALYQRLGLSVTYANDFINVAGASSHPEKDRLVAEARFLRALAYYYQMDLFGNPPFTTEDDGIGKFNPEQIKRLDLYNYVVSELTAIIPDLGDPGFSYPQADKGAAWMLLARIYLNAEVFTTIPDANGNVSTPGTPQWDSVIYYCNQVLSPSNPYELAPEYVHNFSANNDFYSNKEMIFALEADGKHTQGYVGTTFIIESSSDAVYIKAEDYHGLTENTNWNGNRARKEFMNILVDTLIAYSGGFVEASDTHFTQHTFDTRILLKQKKSMDIPAPSSSGDYGIGVRKFTARNVDSTLNVNHSPAFACTDFPIFRLADAYLMRAEAYFRKGELQLAADDINVVRARAFGANHVPTLSSEVTKKFMLDERAREFYYEAHRRTDLIRFGQYTDGSYMWQWKGGALEGTTVGIHRNLFPIPGDEISANPNMKQNPGY